MLAFRPSLNIFLSFIHFWSINHLFELHGLEYHFNNVMGNLGPDRMERIGKIVKDKIDLALNKSKAN